MYAQGGKLVAKATIILIGFGVASLDVIFYHGRKNRSFPRRKETRTVLATWNRKIRPETAPDLVYSSGAFVYRQTNHWWGLFDLVEEGAQTRLISRHCYQSGN
jgi:hypothetical protein